MLGMIGGSGFYKTVKGEAKHVETPYGWVRVTFGKLAGRKVAFMARHGERHLVPPHTINHRANMYALLEIGAKHVVGINACGILSKFKPGDVITIEDFIAFHLRPVTFYDSFRAGAKHTDMSEPYCKKLNVLIAKAGKKAKIKVKKGGIVATSIGPRFETPAEIKAFKVLGANLISMTSAYEAILARELGIRYSSLAIGTNYAAGMRSEPLSHEEVVKTMEKSERKVLRLLGALVRLVK